MEELKAEATELGLDFKGNISKSKLQEMVDEAKNQVANDSPKKDKVVVRISPRDSEEKEGYVGFNGYTAQFQFDEDVEMPTNVVNFLKSKGSYIHDGKGGKKWLSRYLVEYV